MVDGILPVIKPFGMRSMELVERVRHRLRKIYGQKFKVGHTGTLDRAAAGMMPLCVGGACKFTEFFTAWDKEYVAHFRLGIETATHDGEGEIVFTYDGQMPEEESVIEALSSFVGTIEQIPPLASSVKLSGVRAYEMFYGGKSEQQVRLPSRMVTIYEMQIISIRIPDVFVRLRCSKGTYVRAIARDLGRKLGTGAYMAGLIRTVAGPFHIGDAIPLGDLWYTDHPLDALVPIDFGLSAYPIVILSDRDIASMRSGKAIDVDLDDGAILRVKDSRGTLVGVAVVSGGKLKMRRWL